MNLSTRDRTFGRGTGHSAIIARVLGESRHETRRPLDTETVEREGAHNPRRQERTARLAELYCLASVLPGWSESVCTLFSEGGW